jgi:hypothetical protein
VKNIALALSATLAIALVGCTERDGPAERAGERIDDAVSDARDRIEDAGDEVREAAEEVGDALRDE